MSTSNERLTALINDYRVQFASRWNRQKYIWKAVKTFHNCWDINAPDLSKMISNATADADYLMTATLYYPRDMIVGLAKEHPSEVREMFRILFDEETDVVVRAIKFSDSADKLRAGHKGKFYSRNYQTMNAVSTYLWLMYPEKYYFFKYAVGQKVSLETGLEFANRNDSEVDKMLKEFGLLDIISAALRENEDMRKLLDERMDVTLYHDSQLHCMAMDFAFFIRPCYANRKVKNEE